MHSGDLITAVSTPPGRGAIAVIRLSGDGAMAAAAGLFGREPTDLRPRYMYYGTAQAADGIQDKAVFVLFEQGHSYTGEESAEIQCHGSPVVTAAIIKALLAKGARLAEKGEFTRRAYLNGKLDLTQAEGIIDLIDSRSTEAARAAFSQADGTLYIYIQRAADEITEIAAAVGAAIDYPEEGLEEELPTVEFGGVKKSLTALQESYPAGRAAVAGVNVVLIGRPNAGKSTLFNALVGYERAIVTETAGTTRDTVTEGYEYKGVRFHVTDTAGLREAADEPERQGILRSRTAAETADVLLEVDEEGLFTRADALHVLSKSDKNALSGGDISVSGATGDGLEALKETIYVRAGTRPIQDVTLTNLRQYEAVCETLDCICAAEQALKNAMPDCAASELHNALTALSRITGVRAADAVVDRIFARFCVGK